MTGPRTLRFPARRIRIEDAVGLYYQDYRDAVVSVESGVHGALDADGIAVAPKGGAWVHDPIIIAQYAIGLTDLILEGGSAAPGDAPGDASGDAAGGGAAPDREGALREQVAWLLKTQERDGPRAGFWVQRFDNPKYPALRAPWVSALAQGQVISALLRAERVLGDPRCGPAAAAGFAAMRLPVGEGGVYWRAGEEVWLEEYPLDPAPHVLNGAVYALFGVLDYARASGEESAWRCWREGVATVERRIDDFDTGFWSRYDLRTPELASVHYHENIHLPQLDVLASLTGSERLASTAARWRRYARSGWSAFRRRLEGRWRWRRTAAMIGR